MIATDTVPVEVSRSEAARAAADELAKRVYHQDDPGLVSQVLQWTLEQLTRLVAYISAHSPGTLWPLLALPVVLALAILVVRWRVGPLGRSRARQDPIFADPTRSAAEHRRAADAAAGRGDYDTAVRERFRALVRDLEERAVLDARPGRTAGEVVRDVGAAPGPDVAALAAAARRFDEVCYGRRVATADADAVVRAGAEAAHRLRPVTVTAAAGPM